MSRKKPGKVEPTLQAATLPSSENVTSKEDGKMVAYKKMWEFFWNSLTFGEKAAILGGLLVAASAIASAGYWFGKELSQGKLDLQQAESEREKAKLENEVERLKRELSQKHAEDEPTIETAKPSNRTYLDFVSDLNGARSKGALTMSAFVDQYRGKKVRWDCTLLGANFADKWYKIGANENPQPKNQAFAQFRSGEFDRFAKVGDRKTIEGVFRNADDDGIVLYDCRFASESRQP